MYCCQVYFEDHIANGVLIFVSILFAAAACNGFESCFYLSSAYHVLKRRIIRMMAAIPPSLHFQYIPYLSKRSSTVRNNYISDFQQSRWKENVLREILYTDVVHRFRPQLSILIALGFFYHFENML